MVSWGDVCGDLLFSGAGGECVFGVWLRAETLLAEDGQAVAPGVCSTLGVTAARVALRVDRSWGLVGGRGMGDGHRF